MIIIALSVSRTPSLSLGCISSIETCVIGGKEEECTPIWPSKESAHLGGPFKRDWWQLSQNFSKNYLKFHDMLTTITMWGFCLFFCAPIFPQVSYLILDLKKKYFLGVFTNSSTPSPPPFFKLMLKIWNSF